jgi:hypothetical protein
MISSKVSPTMSMMISEMAGGGSMRSAGPKAEDQPASGAAPDLPLPVARPDDRSIQPTNQGAQFTSTAFTDKLAAAGVRVSMDGRRRWLGSVFVGRLWRSLKYEEVHLKAYANGLEGRIGIGQWFRLYNPASQHPSTHLPMPLKRIDLPEVSAVLRARSNIHAGSSCQRSLDPPSREHRRTVPSNFSTASWTRTMHPAQGYQG